MRCIYTIGIGALLLLILTGGNASAQISWGGRPLPPTETRGLADKGVEEMPWFDVAAELRRDSAEDDGLRGGYRFAYKFMTDFRRDNSGVCFTLADGTLVWRLRIRSRDALSINILFTEYELPEGARVFLYNPRQTQILGAFDHRNNSDMGILPVAPVWGDEIIVEYQEPQRASFAGRLAVGEVNHAYRSLLAYEPGGDHREHWCMPATRCLEPGGGRDSLARSTVLLTIDGTRSCTGVMVNNTSGDGRPYLLTASHCLNNNFAITNPDFAAIAGRVICFFNYDSPTCDTIMRGTEEMSVASTHLRAINERYDMALLEMQEMPPACYRPFYAGWTLNEKGGTPPYTVMHHPLAAPKRFNTVEGSLTLATFPIVHFQPDIHWNIAQYAQGCTDAGSSGAPMFDDSCRLVGLLSGGKSTCDIPRDDFYSAFFKSWEPSAKAEEQLKSWLDPENTKQSHAEGLDPYAGSMSYRLSNILENRLSDSIEVAQHPKGGNLFGANTSGATEYAEEYHVFGTAYIEGVYVVTPPVSDDPGKMQVELVVYANVDGDAASKLHSEPFSPTYKDMSPPGYAPVETPKRLNRSQETFVRFASPVKVTGSFFVGYKITNPPNSTFTVYNLRKGMTAGNTTWVHSPGGWIQATQHVNIGFATSLFVDPVIRYTDGSSSEPATPTPSAGIYTERGSRILHITLPQTTAILTLYDVNGRKLREQKIDNTPATVSLENYPRGIYIATLRWGTETYARKLVM